MLLWIQQCFEGNWVSCSLLNISLLSGIMDSQVLAAQSVTNFNFCFSSLMRLLKALLLSVFLRVVLLPTSNNQQILVLWNVMERKVTVQNIGSPFTSSLLSMMYSRLSMMSAHEVLPNLAGFWCPEAELFCISSNFSSSQYEHWCNASDSIKGRDDIPK